MSKRSDENEAPDIEAGMTTAERRRRRRRGAGLRVPSDNVPRRASTAPPVVPPVPEDPNLAVSIAYSFTSDASGPLPRPDTAELPVQELRPDTLTGDGPDVDDVIAPDAQATAVDLEEVDAEGPFEAKTREMTAVDLEELGLEDPSIRRSGPIPARPSAKPIGRDTTSETIIIDDDDIATAIAPPPEKPDRAAHDKADKAASPPPSPLPRTQAQSTPPPTPPQARAKGPTPAPFGVVAATPAPFGVVPAPAPPSGVFDQDEKSVEIEVDDPSRPGEDGPTERRLPPADAGVPVRRAATVALSDDDLEEMWDPEGRSARVKLTDKIGETVQLSDTDLEDIGASLPRMAKATKDESGEIVVDVVEEVDSGDLDPAVLPPAPQAAPIAKLASTPSGPIQIANGAAAPRPPPKLVTSPPPLGTAAASHSPAATQPPPPLPAPHAPSPPPAPTVIAKPPDAAHAPPPAQAKAPPPAPGKKPAGATTAAAVAAAAMVPATDKRAKRGKPWFEEIFDEDYLRTLPFLTPQATQAEAQFVVDALAVQPGAQLLDLGCGYGRHAMELAARGFHLVGLDLSLPLLLRGADEAQRRGLSINFVHADMRELDFDAQFDGVYCLFSTFGFFDDETNKKTASAVARALKPGGRCVIEVLNRDYVIGELPTRVWWEGDGCVVLEEVEFNYFSSRIQSNRSVVFDDGRQIEQEISVRAYSLHELGKLLHSAGFRVVEVSGSVHTRGRYFGNHSRHIIVVAEKKPKDGADK